MYRKAPLAGSPCLAISSNQLFTPSSAPSPSPAPALASPELSPSCGTLEAEASFLRISLMRRCTPLRAPGDESVAPTRAFSTSACTRCSIKLWLCSPRCRSAKCANKASFCSKLRSPCRPCKEKKKPKEILCSAFTVQGSRLLGAQHRPAVARQRIQSVPSPQRRGGALRCVPYRIALIAREQE